MLDDKKFKDLLGKPRIENYAYLIAKNRPLSFVAESFQKIVLNIEYLNVDNNYKIIQFTSTNPSEGKSTTISNIAYLMAKEGKKVLLMDLDLRKPKLNRVFDDVESASLTDYLTGKASMDEIIKTSRELDIDYVINRESSTAVINLLKSKKLSDLLSLLREKYDYILLDSPPVESISDALYITKLSDGVIFVIGYGQAKKTSVKDSVESLRNHGANVLGVILSQVEMKRKLHTYNYYYLSQKEKRKKNRF